MVASGHEEGEVRLDAGTTPNGEGRVFPFTIELRRVLDEQQRVADTLKSEHERAAPFISVSTVTAH